MNLRDPTIVFVKWRGLSESVFGITFWVIHLRYADFFDFDICAKFMVVVLKCYRPTPNTFLFI